QRRAQRVVQAAAVSRPVAGDGAVGWTRLGGRTGSMDDGSGSRPSSKGVDVVRRLLRRSRQLGNARRRSKRGTATDSADVRLRQLLSDPRRWAGAWPWLREG